MNAKAVITALQPLQGHHILILTSQGHGFVHGQPCLRVHNLSPDQRQPGQGNVILWDGGFTQAGHQSGGTFWARDIHSIIWRLETIASIHIRHHARVSIIKLWRLSGAHR